MAQLKKLLQNKLEADTGAGGLVPMLGAGVNSIMPFVRSGTLHEPTSESATPFITVNIGDEMAVDWPLISRLNLEIFIYDQPGQSYWLIDRIVTRLRTLLESAEPQFTTAGAALDSGEKRADFMTEWEMTSREGYDQELQKAFKSVRFGIWG